MGRGIAIEAGVGGPWLGTLPETQQPPSGYLQDVMRGGIKLSHSSSSSSSILTITPVEAVMWEDDETSCAGDRGGGGEEGGTRAPRIVTRSNIVLTQFVDGRRVERCAGTSADDGSLHVPSTVPSDAACSQPEQRQLVGAEREGGRGRGGHRHSGERRSGQPIETSVRSSGVFSFSLFQHSPNCGGIKLWD